MSRMRAVVSSALIGACLQVSAADDPHSRGVLKGDDDAPTGFFPVEQDDLRPTDQFHTQVFGRELTIGGELEFAPDWELAPELTDGEEDDVMTGEEKAALEFLYRWSDRTLLFIETEVFDEDTWFADNRRDRDSVFGLTRKQHWIFWQNLGGTPFSLQLGRQNIAEKREWWWDDELDGARLYYDLGMLHAEVMVAEEMGAVDTTTGFDPRDRDVLRVLGQLKWQWAERHRFEMFFLDEADHSRQETQGALVAQATADDQDRDLTWFGVRQSGSFKIPKTGRFYYWTDAALVYGEETQYDFDEIDARLAVVDEALTEEVAGWALDTGITWRTKLPNKPTVTLAIAVGSGDDSPGSGRSHAFIQTGLNDNNGKFRGVDRFRYYGEFLRPELSNLAVSTISFGTPIMENSSIELVYHGYRQLHKSDFLRDAKVDRDPTGLDPDIGDEVDLIVGIEESAHYEFEFVAGVFRAGNAFGDDAGETAGIIALKLNYNF